MIPLELCNPQNFIAPHPHHPVTIVHKLDGILVFINDHCSYNNVTWPQEFCTAGYFIFE